MRKIFFIIFYFTTFTSFAQLDSLCVEDIFIIENNSFMYKTFKIEVKTYVDQSINIFDWKIYSENQKIYNPYSFTRDSRLKSFVAVPEKLNSIDFLEIIHRSTKFKIKKRDTAFEWLMKYSFTQKKIKHNLTIRHIEPNYTSYEIWNDMRPYAEVIKIDTDTTISKFIDNQLECSNNRINCKINKSKEMIVLFNPLAETYLLAYSPQYENKIIVDEKEICQNAHSVYLKNENNQYAWIYISDNCINGGSATYRQPSIDTMELKLGRYLFIYTTYGKCILYDIKSSILVEINGKLEMNVNELVISYKDEKNNTFLVKKINLVI